MGMMNLQQALDWIRAADPGARLVGDGHVVAARVHTDTRSVQPADLFMALKGEHFDANALLPQARAFPLMESGEDANHPEPAAKDIGNRSACPQRPAAWPGHIG